MVQCACDLGNGQYVHSRHRRIDDVRTILDLRECTCFRADIQRRLVK